MSASPAEPWKAGTVCASCDGVGRNTATASAAYATSTTTMLRAMAAGVYRTMAASATMVRACGEPSRSPRVARGVLAVSNRDPLCYLPARHAPDGPFLRRGGVIQRALLAALLLATVLRTLPLLAPPLGVELDAAYP